MPTTPESENQTAAPPAERLAYSVQEAADPYVGEVLRTFASDQRKVFKLWKDDVTAQVNEYLGEKYPHQDMTIVTESFEIKLARAISERPAQTQNQSRGIRI